MSKLRLYGDTSGYIDVEAPATADNSTLDLSTVAKTNTSNTFDSPQTLSMSETGQIVLTNTGGGDSSTIRQYSDGGMRIYAGDSFQLRTNVSASIAMLADSSGRVTMPSQPAFLVQLTNTATYNTGSTAIPYNAIFLNDGGHYSSGVFTCPVSGRYTFSYGGHRQSIDSNAFELALMKNGLTTTTAYALNQTGRPRVAQTVTISCAANDQIAIHLFTGDMWGGGHSGGFFSGHLVG